MPAFLGPPLRALQVVGVRYWDDLPTQADDSALDAYRAASAYQTPGTDVAYCEVRDVGVPLNPEPVTRLGELCARIGEPVAAGLSAGRPVLVAGGCCSHAPGVVAGMQRSLGAHTRIGIVWFDAHGDFNTPATTISGGLFGMPLAVCAGLAQPIWRDHAGMLAPIPTDRIVLAGARNLDPLEQQLLDATGVMQVRGMSDVAAAAHALARRVDAIYLHVDTDVLDPVWVPTVHLGESDGPSLAGACAAVAQIVATGKVAVYTLASVRNFGEGRDVSVASGVALIRAGLSVAGN